MDHTQHLTTAQYSKDLKRIENAYGVAGIGFYWKAIEILFLNQTPTPMVNLLKNGYKRLSRTEAERIILESGLFDVDELNRVSLKKDKDIEYGIGKKSLNAYFSKLALFKDDASCAEAGTGTCAEACAEACTETCAEACTGTGHCKLNKEKKREENIARETFFIFMEENCRHLLEMAEPLTLAEYRELKKWYTPEQIREVFIDMENDIGLSKRRRNCFQTAFSWLKKRFGNPQNVSAKGSGKVFCGLDEYGTPIYKNQSNNKNNQNNNNGKQDSNSAVCAADAEQQGDGSGCAEWPDE
jgi:hypothetical protein